MLALVPKHVFEPEPMLGIQRVEKIFDIVTKADAKPQTIYWARRELEHRREVTLSPACRY